MANFNAGAIEATLTLDRSPFVAGLAAARMQARRYRETYGELTAEIRVEMDNSSYEIAERRLDDLTEDRSAEIEVGVDSGLARIRIAEISRPRYMNLFVRVVNISQVRGILRSLGNMTLSLSGANVVQNRLRAIRDQLENLDQVAYGLGGLTYLIGNLANVGLTSIANLTSLIGSFGALGGAIIPLPAMITSLATSIGVLAIAFTGWDTEKEVRAMQEMQNALENLRPEWDALAREVRNTFWADLAAPFEEMANQVLPHLREGMVSTADSLNGMVRNWIDAVASIDGSVWDNLFAGISSSIDIANGAIQPLLESFIILGSVGSDNLDRLAEWWVTMSERFNTFVSDAAADGRLQEWIDNAAEAFGDLGTVLGQFGGVLNGITTAFRNAGSTTLNSLADTMTRIHEIVDSDTFQRGLTTIFEGVLAGAGALTDALGPIGDALYRMSPTISYLAEQIGVTLGGALVAVADAMATPAFQQGLKGFFDGLADGINGILPYLPEIAAGFGAVGEVMGAILSNVGPILGEILAGIGGAIVDILPQLLELVDVLGEGLMDTVEVLLPVLSPLITAFADLAVALAPVATELVVALAEGLVLVLEQLPPMLEALTPVIEVIAEMAPLLGDLVVLGFEAMATVLERLEPMWPEVTELLILLFEGIADGLPSVITLVEALVPFAGILLEPVIAMMPAVVDLFFAFYGAVQPLIGPMQDLLTAVGELFIAFAPLIEASLPMMTELVGALTPIALTLAQVGIMGITVAIQFLTPVVNAVIGVIQDLTQMFTRAKESFETDAERITSVFSSMKGTIIGAFRGASGWLKDAAANVIGGFVSGIRDGFDRVKGAFNDLTSRIPNWKGPRERDRVLLKPAGGMIMGGLIDSVRSQIPALRSTLGQVTDEFRLGAGGLSATIDARGPGMGTAATTAGLMDLVSQVVQDRGGPFIGQLTLQAQPGESIANQFDTALFRARVAQRNMGRSRA